MKFTMAKTILYRFDGAIYTFNTLKDIYETVNECEMNVDDDTMLNIINHNLVQNGGLIERLSETNDEIVKWYNDYCDLKDADRYLSISERDESAAMYYHSITYCEDVDTMMDDVLCEAWDNTGVAVNLAKRLTQLLVHYAQNPPRINHHNSYALLEAFKTDNGTCKLC